MRTRHVSCSRSIANGRSVGVYDRSAARVWDTTGNARAFPGCEERVMAFRRDREATWRLQRSDESMPGDWKVSRGGMAAKADTGQ
jgi:hypothetical protein